MSIGFGGTVAEDVRPAPSPATPTLASRGKSKADVVFLGLLWASLAVGIITLIVLVVDTVLTGAPRFNSALISEYASSRPARAGARAALLGTVWVIATTALIALPLGFAAAVYLEEYADKTRWYNRLIELNIQNLAAVPSIVYGILGLAFFVRGYLTLGPSILSGALTLSLLVLPIVIIASREAIRAVPPSIREGSLALGATKGQTTWKQVLPSAVPGMATGSILALSRAIGEAAPLLLISGITFITFSPKGFDSAFTVLPLQIYSWIARPQEEFRTLAAAAIILMLLILVVMNSAAIYIRNRFSRKW